MATLTLFLLLYWILKGGVEWKGVAGGENEGRKNCPHTDTNLSSKVRVLRLNNRNLMCVNVGSAPVFLECWCYIGYILYHTIPTVMAIEAGIIAVCALRVLVLYKLAVVKDLCMATSPSL